ncbi:MAG: MFS transporter [Actinobacteria bacterium]|nr:MFS transporter [Actinomycetota bacterium]
MSIPASLNGLFQLDIHPSSAQLGWISDAFLVPIVVLELSSGVLGDLFGRKRLLVGGAVLVAVGELIAAVSPGASFPTNTRLLVLWTGTGLAGIGAAALFPTSLAMIAGGTHTVRERARGVAIWAAALSFGSCWSPVLGGVFAEVPFGSDPLGGWRWAFLFVVSVAVLSVFVSTGAATNSSSPEGRSLDLPGQLTIGVGLFALLFAIIQAPTFGWLSKQTIAVFAVAVVSLLLFVVVERTSRAPLLRLDFFRDRNFAVASIVTVIGMFAFLGVGYASSIRLSAIQGFSPLKTCVAFAGQDGPAMLLLPITIRLLRRHSPRRTLVLGLVLMAVGAFWLAYVPITDTSLAPVVPAFILVGIGFAFALSAGSMIAVNTPPTHLVGMASGTTNMLRDFGFACGPAIIGAIALSQAAATIRTRLAGSPALQRSLSRFYALPAHVPAAQRPNVEGAVAAVQSGPLGANAIPATVPGPQGTVSFNPLQPIAFEALGHAYALGFVLSGGAAAVAAVLTLIGIRPRPDDFLDVELIDD